MLNTSYYNNYKNRFISTTKQTQQKYNNNNKLFNLLKKYSKIDNIDDIKKYDFSKTLLFDSYILKFLKRGKDINKL